MRSRSPAARQNAANESHRLLQPGHGMHVHQQYRTLQRRERMHDGGGLRERDLRVGGRREFATMGTPARRTLATRPPAVRRRLLSATMAMLVRRIVATRPAVVPRRRWCAPTTATPAPRTAATPRKDVWPLPLHPLPYAAPRSVPATRRSSVAAPPPSARPTVQARQHRCRSASGTCDVAETCSGTTGSCPANGFKPNGTSCNDGLFCTGPKTVTPAIRVSAAVRPTTVATATRAPRTPATRTRTGASSPPACRRAVTAR